MDSGSEEPAICTDQGRPADEQRTVSRQSGRHAVAAGDKTAAETALLAATAEIDKACTKGVYHKNTASRKVSRLSKAVNKMA